MSLARGAWQSQPPPQHTKGKCPSPPHPLRFNLYFDGFPIKMMMKLKNLWEEAIRGTLRSVGHLGKPATWWGLDVLRLYFHPLYFLHLTLMSWCTIALVLHRNSRSLKNQMKSVSQERSYLQFTSKESHGMRKIRKMFLKKYWTICVWWLYGSWTLISWD